MSQVREWRFRLRHILDAIAKIQRYTAGMSEADLAANEMALDAVIRNFQVIGEAARSIPADVKSANPHIPWSDMEKMRHVLVHAYDKIDVPTVWRTIQNDISPLLDQLWKLLEDNA